jgi:hypothetical protein
MPRSLPKKTRPASGHLRDISAGREQERVNQRGCGDGGKILICYIDIIIITYLFDIIPADSILPEGVMVLLSF